MKSVYWDTLAELKSNRTLVLVMRDVQAPKDDFEGFVRDYNEDWIIFDVIVPETGENGGIRIIQTPEITRIRWESQSLKTLALMAQENYKPINKIPLIDLSSINTILRDVEAAYGYVCIHFDDQISGTCYIGNIKSRDDFAIVLNAYPTLSGTDISQLLLKIHDITRIDAGAAYEENINHIAQKYRLS